MAKISFPTPTPRPGPKLSDFAQPTIPPLSPGGSQNNRWRPIGSAGPGSDFYAPENSPAPAVPKETAYAAQNPPAQNPNTPNTAGLLQELKAAFPWLDQLGFSPEFFQNLVAEAASPDEVIVKLRATPQYRQRFPGLWREDGSIRMTEAQYLSTETNYRQVLKQFGYDADYSSVSSLKGFFDSDMDPNELQQRLDTYKQIDVGSQQQKDAFYVYAGVRVSTDDLYEATVDPGKRDALAAKYNDGVAKSSLDYGTWIARATELGLERVTGTLAQLQQQGATTGTAIQQVLRSDPTFAQQMMDQLYQAGGGPTLSLSELLSSFQLAVVGSAASGAGLSLPTKERAQQIVAAGVDRAKAMDTYSQFGQYGTLYREAVRRAGGGSFDQTDFEDAAFLGDAADQGRLAVGLAREESAGKQAGGFQVGQDNLGRFQQTGFRQALR